MVDKWRFILSVENVRQLLKGTAGFDNKFEYK